MNDAIKVLTVPDEPKYAIDNIVYELLELILELHQKSKQDIITHIDWTTVGYSQDKFMFPNHVEIYLEKYYNYVINIKFGKIIGKVTHNCEHYGGLDNIYMDGLKISRNNNNRIEMAEALEPMRLILDETSVIRKIDGLIENIKDCYHEELQ